MAIGPSSSSQGEGCLLGVRIIIAITALGWVSTVGFWVLLYATSQIPSMAEMNSFWETQYGGLIRGFTVADCIWVTLLSLGTIAGPLRMKLWGWTAAMMINATWWYTSTYTLVRDLMVEITMGMVFFLFFAMYAGIVTVYL
jgi:hypothetical protein